jgi:hypothetical protein
MLLEENQVRSFSNSQKLFVHADSIDDDARPSDPL